MLLLVSYLLKEVKTSATRDIALFEIKSENKKLERKVLLTAEELTE